jgi:hypothetical protein
MRFILSRKGFDSSSGGHPSPILNGRPVSLPIPRSDYSSTTYEHVGLGDLVENVTKGKIARNDLCHDDPMFSDRHCWFGQIGGEQTHLMKNGVAIGDVFLFFGLFKSEVSGEVHHRIYGYLRPQVIGPPNEIAKSPIWVTPPRPHPHLNAKWSNNTMYFGTGRRAQHASEILRLTKPGATASNWLVPRWLPNFGLSKHANADRWQRPGELSSVGRGQEFVCDIGDAEEPRRWLEGIIAEIGREP